MLLFGFGAMNGFWGAKVVSLASSGGAVEALPEKAGKEGGGKGCEGIGRTGSGAAAVGGAIAIPKAQIAPRRKVLTPPRDIGFTLQTARESRASVACQYCAAACAEMFCPNLVCVSPMLDELKLAQSEEQIYPERSGKPKDAKPGQTAGRSDFSGCRKRVFEASRSGMRRSSSRCA